MNVIQCTVIGVSVYRSALTTPLITLGLGTAAILAAFILTNKEIRMHARVKILACVQSNQVSVVELNQSTMTRVGGRVNPIVVVNPSLPAAELDSVGTNQLKVTSRSCSCL